LGRISIVELLIMSDAIRSMIMRHVTSGEVRQQAIAEGMQTMYENGLSKAVAGVTTMEEVLRVTREE
jgi:general secretion pathway protein E